MHEGKACREGNVAHGYEHGKIIVKECSVLGVAGLLSFSFCRDCISNGPRRCKFDMVDKVKTHDLSDSVAIAKGCDIS